MTSGLWSAMVAGKNRRPAEMKLLNRYLDPADAAADRARLREAGIASLLETVDAHNIQPSRSGETHVGLWVVVDEQFEDANRLLSEPGHVPLRVLSPAQVEQLESAAERRSKWSKRLSGTVLTLLFFAVLLALIVFTAVDYFVGL